MPDTGPYRFSGKLTRHGRHFQYGDLLVSSGQSDVRGTIAIESSHSGAKIDAELSSQLLRVADLGARAAHRAAEPPAGAQLLLPDIALPVAGIRRGDAVVNFHAARLEVGRLRLHDAAAHVTIDHGVLTIAPLTLPNGNSFPLLITANTASIITLYPRGVMPPESTPKPAPSPTVAPSESPGPSASPPPFETSQPNAGAYGNPPPENGSVIGNYDESGSMSYCAQYAPCSDTNVPMEQQNGAGIIAAPNGFSGLITFSANIGYMGIYPPITNTCPSDWSVVAGISGCSPGPERRVRPRAVQHHV